MPKQIVSQSITVGPSLGTVLLDVTQNIDLYIINGTTTLLSNAVIGPDISNGTPYVGLQYEFLYQADVDITTNNTHFFVFGVDLTQKQCQTQSTITATYNGSGWDVRIMPDFEETGFITANKLANQCEVLVIPVHFENTYTAFNSAIPYYYNILQITVSVTNEIENTDDATIHVQTNVMGICDHDQAITITAGTTVNTVVNYASTLTNNDGCTASQGNFPMLTISAYKNTPGGSALVTLIVERI